MEASLRRQPVVVVQLQAAHAQVEAGDESATWDQVQRHVPQGNALCATRQEDHYVASQYDNVESSFQAHVSYIA